MNTSDRDGDDGSATIIGIYLAAAAVAVGIMAALSGVAVMLREVCS